MKTRSRRASQPFPIFAAMGIGALRIGRSKIPIQGKRPSQRYRVNGKLLGVGDIVNIRDDIDGVTTLTHSAATVAYIDDELISIDPQDRQPRSGWTSFKYRNFNAECSRPTRSIEKVTTRQVAPVTNAVAGAVWDAIIGFAPSWRPRTNDAKALKAAFLRALTSKRSFGCARFEFPLEGIPGYEAGYTGPWLENHTTVLAPNFRFIDHRGCRIRAVEHRIRSAVGGAISHA